ncbi:MAG: ABC transporter permease [Chloroflexi bacterium]|nr:MAG: ABC transporter permease [Chloroflexota bacterium]
MVDPLAISLTHVGPSALVGEAGGLNAQLSAGENVYDSARRELPLRHEFLEALRYRDLVLQLVARDVRTRYKRSVLGVGWTMLSPLLMMVVLSVVFSHLFRGDTPHYPVYVLSALLLWNFFAQSTTSAMTNLVWGGPLLTRIYVPKAVFAISAIGTGLVNLAFALVPLAAIMIATGVPLSPSLLWLPVPVVLTAGFALGVGLLISTLAVSFRDIIEVYQLILTALYFLTPVMYPVSVIPVQDRWWMQLNPGYYFIEAFREPIWAGRGPAPETIAAATVISLVTLAVGWIVFSGRADNMAARI